MRSATLLFTTTFIALALSPAFSNPVVALGTYTIANGEIITQSITADSIVLHANSVAYFANSVTLQATTTISISGVLRDYADSAPRDISLVSARDIVVEGWIIGESGAAQANATSNTTLDGENGGDGASIYLEWGTLGSFTLGAGATIQSGAGGQGANVTIEAGADAPLNLTGRGGLGGSGGRVTLNGLVGANYGTIIAGRAGLGGSADVSQVVTDPNATILHPDANVSAIGGDPGLPGEIDGSWVGRCIPNCGTMTKQGPMAYQAGAARAVKESQGGSWPWSRPPPPGATGESCGTSYARGAPASYGGQKGQDAEARNDGCIPGSGGYGCPGGLGGTGGSAEAYGGRGGDSMTYGGNGGWARAIAGAGGNGGPGSNGCSGGNGGNGGRAIAVGGDGGNGGWCPGNGGTATASAGAGGYGGSGSPAGSSGSSGGASETPGARGGGGTTWCN